jgi:hypothetical protein
MYCATHAPPFGPHLERPVQFRYTAQLTAAASDKSSSALVNYEYVATCRSGFITQCHPYVPTFDRSHETCLIGLFFEGKPHTNFVTKVFCNKISFLCP